ncbi:MAG: hypothetical protein J6M21_08355 [Campylobacter sp.]|nr:hypothetical protein [Campylobacter sp.]
MTNSKLCEFYDSLHSTLKIDNNNNLFIIKEQGNKSSIKELHFTFENRQDVVIIQQKSGNCPALTNIFNGITNLKSCDFIVLIKDRNEIKSYFCEIKSSITKEQKDNAIKQIESSKIFFEYLQQNYRLYFETQDFNIDIEKAKSVFIYPKLSNSQKRHTYGDRLQYIPVKVNNNGISDTLNGYDLFKNL